MEDLVRFGLGKAIVPAALALVAALVSQARARPNRRRIIRASC
jgi:hypothetical protein